MAPEPNSENEEEEESAARKATIAGLGVSRKTMLWTAAGVLVAIGGLVFAISGIGDGNRSDIQGNENSVAQGENSSITNNYYQAVQDFAGALPPNAGESQIREAAKKYANVTPQGVGPWPFVVIADPQLGMKVRTTGDVNGVQIGSAAHNAAVWADCRRDTGFNPQPGDPNGAVWYRIKWPSVRPSTEFLNSSPGDQYNGWAYGGLVVPIGQNGLLPMCS